MGRRKTETDSGDLLPRKLPSQGRSRETVTKILEATRVILANQGHRALTTILVAETSGVTVGSIYQYFPSKHAIIYALYAEWLESALSAFDDAYQSCQNEPAQKRLATILRTFLDDDQGQENRELVTAMASHPELAAVEEQHTRNMVARITPLLREMLPTARNSDTSYIARCLLELSVAMIEVVQDAPSRRKAETRDWAEKTMKAAMENFLPPQPSN